MQIAAGRWQDARVLTMGTVPAGHRLAPDDAGPSERRDASGVSAAAVELSDDGAVTSEACRYLRVDRQHGAGLARRGRSRCGCRSRLAERTMAMPFGEPVEHHRGGQEHADRIRLAGADDVRSAAVAGLEHGVVVADVGRGGKADPAEQRGAEIGQDVAEHVLGDDDVEVPGLPDQIERGGVDVRGSARDASEWRTATSSNTLRKKANDDRTLALSTQVTVARRPNGDERRGGRRSPTLSRRPERVTSIMSHAIRSSSSSRRAPCEQPLGDSRMRTKSIFAAPVCEDRLSPGMVCTGRTRHRGRAPCADRVAARPPSVGIADMRQAHRAEQDRVGLGPIEREIRGVRLRCGGVVRARFVAGEREGGAVPPAKWRRSVRAWVATSRPMPSPGSTAMRCDGMPTRLDFSCPRPRAPRSGGAGARNCECRARSPVARCRGQIPRAPG